MNDRRSWSASKGARRDTAARREGYRRAKEAFAAQEVRSGPIRTIGVEARRRGMVGEGQQRALECCGGYNLLTEHRRRMDVRRLFRV